MPTDVDAVRMPLTANRQLKQAPRVLTRSEGLHDVDQEDGLPTCTADLENGFSERVHALKHEPNVIDTLNIGLVTGIALSPRTGEPGKRAYPIVDTLRSALRRVA